MSIKKASVKKGMGYVLRSVAIISLYLGAVIGTGTLLTGCVEFAYKGGVHFKTQMPTIDTRIVRLRQTPIQSAEVVNAEGVNGEGAKLADASKSLADAEAKIAEAEAVARTETLKAKYNAALIKLEEEKRYRIEAEENTSKRNFATFVGRNR